MVMTAHPAMFGHQRSAGTARVALIERRGKPRVSDLHQKGSAKAIILDPPEVVFLNTSGGLTGGDRLDYQLSVGAECRITATTQTAERVYRARSGSAQIRVKLDVAEGAHLDWLPQETILFQDASAQRRTEVALAPGATCLMTEALVLGRAAMGETVTNLAFLDRRMISRAGRPLHLEALRLDAQRLKAGAAGLAGARALASVVLVAPDAADALSPVRAAMTEPDCLSRASALEDRMVIRLMAPDGWPLRRQLARILTLLRRGPLPRVWQI